MFSKSRIDYNEYRYTFTTASPEEAIPVDVARKTLYEYVKPKLLILQRREQNGGGFDREYYHICDIITQKAIKDMLIRDHI